MMVIFFLLNLMVFKKKLLYLINSRIFNHLQNIQDVGTPHVGARKISPYTHPHSENIEIGQFFFLEF
jgi:hypothetical protein